jgi:hypothetical protein
MEGELVLLPVMINSIIVKLGIHRWIKSGWSDCTDVSFRKTVDLLRNCLAFTGLEK